MPELIPSDTSRLRTLLNPWWQRNLKYGLPTDLGRDAVMDDLIKNVLIVDSFQTALDEWAGPYREHAAVAGGGTTPNTPPGGPPPARAFSRPEDLAAVPNIDAFRDYVIAMPRDELERLNEPPADDVDVFSAEQHKIIDDVLAGRERSDVFEIEQPDDRPPTGAVILYDGRQVVVLGLSQVEGMMRVAYVDPEERRAD